MTVPSDSPVVGIGTRTTHSFLLSVCRLRTKLDDDPHPTPRARSAGPSWLTLATATYAGLMTHRAKVYTYCTTAEAEEGHDRSRIQYKSVIAAAAVEVNAGVDSVDNTANILIKQKYKNKLSSLHINTHI